MDRTLRRTIVVSGVNLRKGGTLTVFRSCLKYLASRSDELRIVALVHDRGLFDYDGIEYVEIPWSTRSWVHRLWCEYVTMHWISREIAAEDGRKVWMWLSMHDTTPRVEAEHQEVYCHTSFPFLKIRLRDWAMDPKIPLFALFTRFAYRINVHRNDCLIVQQEWFKEGLSELVGFPAERIRVIPPERNDMQIRPAEVSCEVHMFLYASTPDCHKNFELLCKASDMLEKRVGKGQFLVVLTVAGDENRYARWLKRKWGRVQSICFHGFMTKEELWGHYAAADCLVFPSRIETWGLPISEFLGVSANGRALLADLPYAHESSAGADNVKFFPTDDAGCLADLMYESIASR